MSKEEIAALPEANSRTVPGQGADCTLTTYRYVNEDQETLIVVQALVPTWKKPTFFTFTFVGKVFAEGFIVKPSGEIVDAESIDLAPFR
jgi:hypothetical protein